MSRVLVQYARCGHELDTARSRFPATGPAENFIRVPGICPRCDEAANGQLTASHASEVAAMRARHAEAAQALRLEQQGEEAALKQRHAYELVCLWSHQGRELSAWAHAVLKSGPGPGQEGTGPTATNGSSGRHGLAAHDEAPASPPAPRRRSS